MIARVPLKKVCDDEALCRAMLVKPSKNLAYVVLIFRASMYKDSVSGSAPDGRLLSTVCGTYCTPRNNNTTMASVGKRLRRFPAMLAGFVILLCANYSVSLSPCGSVIFVSDG